MEQASLDDRLTTLERRASRLRWVALLAVILAAATPAWLLLGERPAIVESQLWMVRDSSGTVRALFGLTNDGVALTMYDSTGQVRLDLGLAPGGVPGLLLLSERGEPVAALNLRQEGRPVLRLSDFAARERIDLEPKGLVGLPPSEPTPPDTMIARQPLAPR
ncbi:MAG: hypothetical protein R2909_15440 [Gemmatimonadales bacterium]